MAGYIPDDIVERIKSESDIVTVISAFVNLKKSGKDYKGLCPFHQEKTPSFFVIPGKGFYHCFGCGAGGNAVNFIMAHERLDYPDALRYLANKAGITIPETKSAPRSDIEALYEALALAGAFFASSLKGESGSRILEYLKSRDITSKTIGEFGIGYAPSGWDNLIRFTSSKGLSPATLEKVGLAAKKDNYYDRFRNRLMIPIRALSGRIVGFGGRVLPGSDDAAKYINSPETEIYKKGKLLFGLDLGRDEIRAKNEAIVVEGYFDLISLYQRGIKNVVAVSGTGFTTDQAALLARFCERVVLLYDSDSAGIKAAYRACGMLYNTAVRPQVALLPKGYDPDKFVREMGPDRLLQTVEASMDIIDLVDTFVKGDFSSQPLSIQSRLINALTDIVKPIENRATRKVLLDKMHERLHLDIRTINRITEEYRVPRPDDSAGIEGKIKPEKEFISLLLAHPELINKCGEVSSKLFVSENNARIFGLIRELYVKGDGLRIADLFDRMESDELRRVLSEIGTIEIKRIDIHNLLSEFLDELEMLAQDRRREELKNLLDDAVKRSDEDKIKELTIEFENLQSRGAWNTAKRSRTKGAGRN
ncbi:MAG: DNA primase [candidate division Zixibacteria bacterium RBG_16_53_22]|nr:MAG: DNA primase [candidate division Zixibacteria bacterium RBG_16_53_22]